MKALDLLGAISCLAILAGIILGDPRVVVLAGIGAGVVVWRG